MCSNPSPSELPGQTNVLRPTYDEPLTRRIINCDEIACLNCDEIAYFLKGVWRAWQCKAVALALAFHGMPGVGPTD